MIHPEVAQHIPAIRALCRQFGVSRLSIFGSAVTDGFDPEWSDVDLLVTYSEDYDFGHFAERLFRFEDRLAALLGRDVDLVIDKRHRNRFFAHDIERTREDIYVAAGPSGDAPAPRAEQVGATAHMGPRPMHQRTLKLLEDIRLACADVTDLAQDIATRTSLSDRLTHDAITWGLQKTGHACKRLKDRDAGTASRIDHLPEMVELSDNLAYGSGVEVGDEQLGDAIHRFVPEIRIAVTALIERLEHEEQAASR